MILDPRSPTSRTPSASARILVRLPNWLGDVLLARPLLHGLRASLPAARVRAVAPAPLLELLAGDGVFDERDAWPAGGTARAALAGALRAWRPDVALVLPPSFSSAWLAWRTGAPVRVGFRGDARDALLTHAVARPPRGDRHLSDEYLDLGSRVHVTPAPVPRLGVADAAHAAARALIAETARGREGVAVLGPGAIFGPAKRWPAERFVAVGRTLVRSGLAVLVCGAASEADTCQAVAGAIGDGAVTLAGRTDLTTQAALCAAARVAVCNDSGLAHLAAAVGTPTVVVFGSTSSAWTAPLGERVRVVQDAPVCAPCFQRTCRIGYVCLAAVSVATVESACREILAAEVAR